MSLVSFHTLWKQKNRDFLFSEDTQRDKWHEFVSNKAKGRTFLTLCVSGGKKCSFFGKFGALCFLETPVLTFTLLPYYRRNGLMKLNTILLKQPQVVLYEKYVFCKKSVCKNFTKLTWKQLCWSLFLIKKVLSCDFREIFKNTFCYRKHPETASYTPYFHYHLAETFGTKYSRVDQSWLSSTNFTWSSLGHYVPFMIEY